MNLKSFETKLLAEKETLEKQVRYLHSEDPYADKTRNRGIIEDDVTDVEEHDRLSATKDELERSLTDVKDALKRLADGKFGNCSNCGEKISPERLEIMPSARYCLACQKRLNRA